MENEITLVFSKNLGLSVGRAAVLFLLSFSESGEVYHSVARDDCLIHHCTLSKRYVKNCQIKRTQTSDC